MCGILRKAATGWCVLEEELRAVEKEEESLVGWREGGPADERIDEGVVEARNVHAECAQASELGYEPTHELPQAGCPDRVSAGEDARTQKMYDSVEEGKVIIMSDKHEAEGFEVG